MRRGTAILSVAVVTLTACSGHQRLRADLPMRIGPAYRVAGRTYVPADDRHYEATGIASWYGAEQKGARTASGERFDPDAITAAHRTLPLPSYVEVTALDSGRSLIVRINDRGPFVRDRLIDLSRGAARRLDMERLGSIRVRVRRVYPTAVQLAVLGVNGSVAAPATSTRRTSPKRKASEAGQYFVRVATFTDPARAARAAIAVVGEVVVEGGRSRVRIGPFADAQAAQPALARAQAAGYQDALVVRDALVVHDAMSRSAMDLPQ